MPRRLRNPKAFVVYETRFGKQKVEVAEDAASARVHVNHAKSVLERWPTCGASRALGIWRLKTVRSPAAREMERSVSF